MPKNVSTKCMDSPLFIIAKCSYFLMPRQQTLKPCQNKKGQKFVSAASKMASFSQLPAVKKAPFLVRLKQIFCPSYFVTALVRVHSC